MKRVFKKGLLPKPQPVTVTIDPMKLMGVIEIPKVEYKIVADIDYNIAFEGMVLPIPKVLVYYLTKIELHVLSIILEECMSQEYSTMTVKGVSKKLKASVVSVSNALYFLRKGGLILEAPNGRKGGGRMRKLNFETIQHLNDLAEGEDVGIFARIRKLTKKKTIINITKDDIKTLYNHVIHEPGDDIAEEEEYD